MLDASMSSDADSDPLTFAWSQTVGPNVMLSNPAITMPTFTAPQVAADTMLTFQVDVGDGLASGAPGGGWFAPMLAAVAVLLRRRKAAART